MMYKVDKLILMTGKDINVPELSAKIHQPTINEISVLGEGRFFQATNLFFLNEDAIKSNLKEVPGMTKETINLLDSYTILLLFLEVEKDNRKAFVEIMELILQGYEIGIEDNNIIFSKENYPTINFSKETYLILKDIMYEMFQFDKLLGNTLLNVQSDAAKKIAEKMRKAKEKIERNEGKKEQISIFNHYLSILSIGSNASNINDNCELTIYQLYNQFERFSLYLQYDQSVKTALAGAKTDIVDWFKEI